MSGEACRYRNDLDPKAAEWVEDVLSKDQSSTT